MRRALMEAFDELYLLNLHGNAREGETAPDGSPTKMCSTSNRESPFLIAVRNFPNADAIDKIGDAIDTIGTRNDRSGVPIDTIGDAIDRIGDPDDKIGDAIDKIANPDDSAVVWYCDVWGTREAKYAFLNQHTLDSTPWQALQPQPPFYLFAPQDDALRTEYERGWRLTDIFRLHSTGIKTHRDHFAIDFDLQEPAAADWGVPRPDHPRRRDSPTVRAGGYARLETAREPPETGARLELAGALSSVPVSPLRCALDLLLADRYRTAPRRGDAALDWGAESRADFRAPAYAGGTSGRWWAVSDKLTECCAISNKTGGD
jgi:hypothetical protein